MKEVKECLSPTYRIQIKTIVTVCHMAKILLPNLFIVEHMLKILCIKLLYGFIIDGTSKKGLKKNTFQSINLILVQHTKLSRTFSKLSKDTLFASFGLATTFLPQIPENNSAVLQNFA